MVPRGKILFLADANNPNNNQADNTNEHKQQKAVKGIHPDPLKKSR